MTFSNALEGKKWADEADARLSLARRRERFGQTPEQVGFGTSGGEGSPRLFPAAISRMITSFAMRDGDAILETDRPQLLKSRSAIGRDFSRRKRSDNHGSR